MATSTTKEARKQLPMLAYSRAKKSMFVGSIVGGYRIVEPLGAGGMGEVYVGEHVRIVRRVAVKFLLPELTGNREIVDRFFAEARATSSIRHPGIVEIFDCDVDANGRAYIVMELLAGESLSSRLEHDGKFGRNIDRPLAVAEQIANALNAAHANGIIHRDLKPENVFLVGRDLEVKIFDFGIAKLLAHNQAARAGRASITIPGSLLGTPKYMSPEQCCDASNVDHRTDIYSLGCILFEMLSGRPPFVANSFAELVAAHLTQAPPAVGELRAGIPDRVRSLVERLLAKAPADRPSTMEEVRTEIATVRADLVREESGAVSMPGGPVRARRRSRAVSIVALATVFVAGGALVFVLSHRSNKVAPLSARPAAPATVVHDVPMSASPPSLPAPATPERLPTAMETQEPGVEAASATSPGGAASAAAAVTAAAPAEPPLARRKTATTTAPSPRRPPRPTTMPDLSEEARKL